MSNIQKNTEHLVTDYKYGFHYDDHSVFKTEKGLNAEVVRAISEHKQEPQWMLEFRLRSLEEFEKKDMIHWGADLSRLDFNEIYYYAKPTQEKSRTWDDLPPEIKETYDRIGVPEAEKNFLAGVRVQDESQN